MEKHRDTDRRWISTAAVFLISGHSHVEGCGGRRSGWIGTVDAVMRRDHISRRLRTNQPCTIVFVEGVFFAGSKMLESAVDMTKKWLVMDSNCGDWTRLHFMQTN